MFHEQNTVASPAQLCADLGGHWQGNCGKAPCPICQPERRPDQNALSIKAEGNRLLLHCHKAGCGFADLLVALGIRHGTFQQDHAAIEAQRRERQAKVVQKRNNARQIWTTAQSIIGTEGERYLRSRGITCSLPACLRWATQAYHGPSKTRCSAIIADVAPTGGIHRTFFDQSGLRLTQNAKMMLGPCAGGAVRLSGGAGPLLVCEGLETGLSLLSGLLSVPHKVWAALSTSGMKTVSLPPDPDELIVATDGDDAGRTAGLALASHAYALGWQVKMLNAPDGQDFNDVLRNGELG
jgi:Toprim domain